MDPLDDVFAAMRLQSALYSRLTPRAPWGVSFVKSASIRFGFMIEGSGWLVIDGAACPIFLQQGEGFIVQPHTPFSLRDTPTSPTRWCEEVFADNAGEEGRFGGAGEPADMLCGYLTFDNSGAEPLLSLLPAVVTIPADATRSPLLEATLKLLALETIEKNLGSRIVISRLADVLFVQAIRAHCLREQTQRGWIAALSDAKLRGVIQKIHHDIAYPWSLQSLASQAAMSRSSFAVHFKAVTGDTPGDYLTQWRMYRARCLLRHPQLTLTTIAERVGYDSAITLGRAFKRFQGITPGEYRQQQGLTLPTAEVQAK
ncbi:AraC family transcriptional regulator [Rouxiella silvae]|uniref:AraC family transcriptional regulator n=1 Tax=Rouxiella silvae TaxID=1646373 RepID=A0AA40WXU9_9GAMM|nr:AraC family transcriptional regulator [Rouxiella silvae]MBF6635062.1 AraC family transcriptional regulator [Rouxiella silvae]ORJ20510.1 AraC family transcriptional regulator [Rouxiella silvae]